MVGIDLFKAPAGRGTGSAPPDGPPFEEALKQAVPAGMNRTERENRAEDGPRDRSRNRADESGSQAMSADESGDVREQAEDERSSGQPAVGEEPQDPIEYSVEAMRPTTILTGLESSETMNGAQGAILTAEEAGVVISDGRRLAGTSGSQGGSEAMNRSSADAALESARTTAETRTATPPGSSTSFGSGESVRPVATPVPQSTPQSVDAGVDPGSIRLPESMNESKASVASGTTRTPDSTLETIAPGSATSRSGDGRMVLPEGFQAVPAGSARPASERGRSTSSSASPVSNDEQAARPAAVARAETVNAAIRAARAEGQVGEVTVAAPSAAGTTAARGGMETAQGMPGQAAGLAPNQDAEGGGRTMPGVGRGLDALARQRGGTLTMRLDPPSLGHLKLEMKMDGARVTVLMTAASDSARSLLRNNMGSLRQALEDRGFAVDRLAVETAGKSSEGTGSSRSEGRGDGNDARGGQDASGRQDAGDGRSRGRRDDASNRRAGRGDDLTRQEAANFGETLAEVAVSGN